LGRFAAEEDCRMPSPAATPSDRDRPEDLQEFHACVTPMWIFDQGTLEILEVNAAATEYYGCSRGEFLKDDYP
jgi:PAS domain-containing protein